MQGSPKRLDRLNNNILPNLDSAAANDNGVVALAQGEHTRIAHKVVYLPLMPSIQPTDPCLRRTADSSRETLPSVPFKVTHSHNSTYEGTEILFNVFKSVQDQISPHYQRLYEMHQRNFAEYRKNNQCCQNDAKKRSEDLHEKYRKAENRRGEEKGRWEAERKEFVKRINHYKMLIAVDLNERKSLAAQSDSEKYALTQQLKSSYVERNSIVNRLEEEKSNWEMECNRLSKIVESSQKGVEIGMEQLGLERDRLAAVCATHEQERNQWKHEKAIMTVRLRDERTAREGLVAALRLRGDDLREDGDIGRPEGDERVRKRMCSG